MNMAMLLPTVNVHIHHLKMYGDISNKVSPKNT